jgi:nucleoside-triphosphatase THEP1
VADLARRDGLKVMGILSRRILTARTHASYEIHDQATGETWPLVLPKEDSPGEGWETHGNPVYVFSVNGFEKANKTLGRAAELIGPRSLVFVDEFGRLESDRKGIYPGALAVADGLCRGGTAVFLCRTERVEEVRLLLESKADKILVFEARDPRTVYDAILNF